MKKETLIAAGEAAYGRNWVTALAEDLSINRKTIQRYNSGELQPKSTLAAEIIAVLQVRKAAISCAETELINDLSDDKEDLTAEFYAVSEGGHLLDERFETLESAKTWVAENFEDDDLHLASFCKMTLAEIQALEVMRHFSDVYDPEKVLKAIKSGHFEKSTLEYCLVICSLDENAYGKEYYKYIIANEFGLSNTPSFSDKEDFESIKTITYKQFIMKRIAELSQFVATNL